MTSVSMEYIGGKCAARCWQHELLRQGAYTQLTRIDAHAAPAVSCIIFYYLRLIVHD